MPEFGLGAEDLVAAPAAPMSATAAPLTASAVRFDPRFSVQRVDGAGVFLVSEDATAVLGEPIHLALAGLIDGIRSADDLADALADRFQHWPSTTRWSGWGRRDISPPATVQPPLPVSGPIGGWPASPSRMPSVSSPRPACGWRRWVASTRVVLEDALAGAGLLAAPETTSL